MRKFGALLLVVFCLAILAISYSSWKEKIEVAAEKPLGTLENSKAAQEVPETKKVESATLTIEALESLTAGMDETTRNVLVEKFKKGGKTQLLIVGSNAIESGNPGVASILRNEIDKAYKGFIETTIVSFNGTSESFMNEDMDLSQGFDVVLMEPFTLKNNGNVEIEAEREDILEFIGEVRTTESDAVLLLQPPQPIYGAQFYLTQVKALEEFAIQQKFGYVNHWPAWPETTNKALKDYLTEDGLPNSKGAAVWASELKKYFITE